MINKNLVHAKTGPLLGLSRGPVLICGPLFKDLPSFLEDTTDVLCRPMYASCITDCYMVTLDGL